MRGRAAVAVVTAAGPPRPDDAVPPSVRAARQALALHRLGGDGRAYPLTAASHDPEVLSVQFAATHALVRAESAAEVAAVVATFVHDLGGAIVPARYADSATAVPVDVSLGLSEPLLPVADPISAAAMRLGAVLPEFLESARLVLSRLQGDLQRQDEATRDPLTGLLTRRAWMRQLSRAIPGDSVCLIDLDYFKSVNDTNGHDAGDAVLRAFGGLMARTFRVGDICGRYGGDEMVCLTAGLPARGLIDRCEQLRQAWKQERPSAGVRVGLSIGVAQVRLEGGRAALKAADAAMYRGKTGRRDRTVLATPDDYDRGGPT